MCSVIYVKRCGFLTNQTYVLSLDTIVLTVSNRSYVHKVFLVFTDVNKKKKTKNV
jgi:hypothetical protein